MRNRLLCLVCLALLPTFCFAQQKAPSLPADPGDPSICDGFSDNVIFNCGFENEDLSGWLIGGDQTFMSASQDNPNSGNWSAKMGPVDDTASLINARIDLKDNQTAFITFWLANPNGGSGTFFSVKWNGVEINACGVDVPVCTPFTDSAPFPYQKFISAAVPVAGNDILEFIVRQDPDYFYLDDVIVTPPRSSVPQD